MCCNSWRRKESDMTERLNWIELRPRNAGSANSEAIERLANSGISNHSERWKDKGRRPSDLSPESVGRTRNLLEGVGTMDEKGPMLNAETERQNWPSFSPSLASAFQCQKLGPLTRKIWKPSWLESAPSEAGRRKRSWFDSRQKNV